MRKLVVLSIVCVALSAALMIWGFAEREESAAKSATYIALMTEDRGTDAMQFRQGAQQAADEIGADFTTRAIDVHEDKTQALLSAIGELEAEDFDGLILPACDASVYGAAVDLAQRKQATLLCLFAADERAAASIITDQEARGAQIAESVLGFVGNDSAVVYALPGEGEEADAMRKGFETALSARGISPNYISLDDLTSIDGRQTDATAVYIAFTAVDTEALCIAIDGVRGVWGVDLGEARIALLEENKVMGLSMEMPYIRGYLAVQALNDKSDGEKTITCPTRVVTTKTMYDSENVKLVFPLIQ